MATDEPVSFHCPNCNAHYQVVKVEVGPETVDREITCLLCHGPLAARDGKFVLKYFLLRKAGRVQKWRKPERAKRAYVKPKTAAVTFKFGRGLEAN